MAFAVLPLCSFEEQPHQDETFARELVAIINTPFVPMDFPTMFTSNPTGCDRHGPRGGKKPLRPWQQQLCSLKAELERKMLDLKNAQEEGERLRQRLKVLEVVLPLREQLTELVKQRCQAALSVRQTRLQMHRDIARPQRPPALHAPPSSGSPTCSSGAPPSGSDATCPNATTAAQFTNSSPPSHHLPFSLLGANTQAPAHVIQQLATFWNQWIRDAALTLHGHDARPHDLGPYLELQELRQRLVDTFSDLRSEYPLLFKDLMYINLKTDQRDEPPPESFWLSVAKGMCLSQEQAAACREVLALYHERVAGTLTDRRNLMQQLAACLDMPSGVCTNQQLEDVTAQLYKNVVHQGHMLEVVKDFMGSRVFSLAQMVRACVLSYPYFPDAIAIISSIADGSNDSKTQATAGGV